MHDWTYTVTGTGTGMVSAKGGWSSYPRENHPTYTYIKYKKKIHLISSIGLHNKELMTYCSTSPDARVHFLVYTDSTKAAYFKERAKIAESLCPICKKEFLLSELRGY